MSLKDFMQIKRVLMRFIKVSEIDLEVLGKGLQNGFAGRHQGGVDWDRKLPGERQKNIQAQPTTAYM